MNALQSLACCIRVCKGPWDVPSPFSQFPAAREEDGANPARPPPVRIRRTSDNKMTPVPKSDTFCRHRKTFPRALSTNSQEGNERHANVSSRNDFFHAIDFHKFHIP